MVLVRKPEADSVACITFLLICSKIQQVILPTVKNTNFFREEMVGKKTSINSKYAYNFPSVVHAFEGFKRMGYEIV